MLHVAVIGCGLIGKRRATIAACCPETSVDLVVDTNGAAASALGQEIDCRWSQQAAGAIGDASIDVLIVATPTASLTPLAVAGLRSGKHVLIEKPMGRNLDEALTMSEAAREAGRVLKVGFNHRYHPAIAEARELVKQKVIGRILNIRARYGHGARPGYEREWRCDPELSGGGELTDQGVHLFDLINWFLGLPNQAFAYLQTADWPIAPLEDNGFGLFRCADGAVASIHTSWTQWKNLFSFEVFGDRGAVVVDGLGGSYGVERLTIMKRNPAGGAPECTERVFDQSDSSWSLEWDDFLGAVTERRPYYGGPDDGVAAMRMLDALYRSSAANAPVTL